MTEPAVCASHVCFAPYRFTGKERDSESGNDYFGARYYASSMGRFMSPDWSAKEDPVPYAKLDDPQTLNLYAYVGNNPLSRVDADGHSRVDGAYPVEGDGGQLVTNGIGVTFCVGGPCSVSSDSEAWQDYSATHSSASQAQQQKAGGTSIWHGLSNLFHGHSWNYVRTGVATTETYSVPALAGIAGRPAPMADPQAVFNSANASPARPPTPRNIPREVPGSDPVDDLNLVKEPGDIPEIEPGASMAQKWGVAILNLVKGFGQNVEAMPVVCFTCNMTLSPEQKAMFGTPPED